MAVAVRVQLVDVKVPVEFDEKPTLPVGVIAVPEEEVSLTVAVQVVCWLTTTDPGEQATIVEVVRGVTITLTMAA